MELRFKNILLCLIPLMVPFVILSCSQMDEDNKVTLDDVQKYINSGDQKEYSWYQRVTLTVPTEEGEVSGSSVMKITWTKNSPRINDAPWIPKITGEMPFVKLPDGVYVFSLLRNKYRNLPPSFLLDSQRNTGWVTEKEISLASRSDGNRICFGDHLFPFVVSFGRGLSEADASIYLNEDMCLSIERINQEAVSVLKVTDLLPWLVKLQYKRSKVRFPIGEENINGKPLQHRVTSNDFFRD